MRRAACAIVAWAAASACRPTTWVVDRAVEEGDAAVVVLGPLDALITRVLRADASGTAALEADAELRAAVVIPREAVLDLTGAPAALEGLAADLDGDRADRCGCSAPALGDRLRVAPGDRCPAPAPLRAFVDPALGPEVLDARLRLTWPGACACGSRAIVGSVALEVCPLGVDAERIDPTAIALARDGTLTLLSRSTVIERAPDGRTYETPIDPAFGQIAGVAALPGGGVLLGSLEYASIADKVVSWVRRVRGRGAGLDPAPLGLAMYRERIRPFAAHHAGALWGYGAHAIADASRPKLVRCPLAADVEDSECAEVTLPYARCAQLDVPEPIIAVTEREDGTLIGAVQEGVFAVSGGGVSCGPATLGVSAPGGGALRDPIIRALAAAGPRLAACVSTSDGRALVLTASVGPTVDALAWRVVAEDVGALCRVPAFTEPGGARAVVRTTAHDYRLSRASGPVEVLAPGALYPEVGDFTDVDTTTAAMALLSLRGEVFMAREGRLPARAWSFPRAPTGIDARAVQEVPGGFRVFTGGARPIEVRSADRCADVEVHAPLEALAPPAGARDDAVVSLGDRTLVFGVRDDAPVMIVRDASDTEVAVVPAPGPVRAAAEVVPGRAAAVLLEDGRLFSTDGAALAALDDRARWAALDAAHGVGWVAADDRLARVVAGADGALEVVAAEPMVDSSAFDARLRERPARVARVRALCGGRALVTYHEELTATLAGEISDVTAWLVEPAGGRLVMTSYTPLVRQSSRPYAPQVVAAIVGPDDAPVLAYSAQAVGVGLHAPGVTSAALPFLTLSGAAGRGSQMLFGSRDLRLTWVTLR